MRMRKKQAVAAVEVMERVGAVEVNVQVLAVGAGRPDWLHLIYVTDGGERRDSRVSPSGHVERLYPDYPLPESDPEYHVPYGGPSPGPQEPYTDADRDLTHDRVEEMDWARSAAEQER